MGVRDVAAAADREVRAACQELSARPDRPAWPVLQQLARHRGALAPEAQPAWDAAARAALGAEGAQLLFARERWSATPGVPPGLPFLELLALDTPERALDVLTHPVPAVRLAALQRYGRWSTTAGADEPAADESGTDASAAEAPAPLPPEVWRGWMQQEPDAFLVARSLAVLPRAVLDLRQCLETLQGVGALRLRRTAQGPVLTYARGTATGPLPGFAPRGAVEYGVAARALSARPDLRAGEATAMVQRSTHAQVLLLRHPALRLGAWADGLLAGRRAQPSTQGMPDVDARLLALMRQDPAVARARIAEQLTHLAEGYGTWRARLYDALPTSLWGDAGVMVHLSTATRARLLQDIKRDQRLALLSALGQAVGSGRPTPGGG